MRRAPIVLVATIVGTTGVLMFKPKEPSISLSTSTSTGTSSSSSSSSSSGTTVTKSGTTTTATGAGITSQFGTTQVKVTIKAGKITDVAVVQENSNEPQSQQISEAAFPTLKQSALDKQSAAIDSVSGATYTSQQYAASLQSALDKAGFTAADGSTAPTTAPTAETGRGGHGGGPFGF
jgi:uncharacterized protein with FMN-binding domain